MFKWIVNVVSPQLIYLTIIMCPEAKLVYVGSRSKVSVLDLYGPDSFAVIIIKEYRHVSSSYCV